MVNIETTSGPFDIGKVADFRQLSNNRIGSCVRSKKTNPTSPRVAIVFEWQAHGAVLEPLAEKLVRIGTARPTNQYVY
jgi:hypothetical protein